MGKGDVLRGVAESVDVDEAKIVALEGSVTTLTQERDKSRSDHEITKLELAECLGQEPTPDPTPAPTPTPPPVVWPPSGFVQLVPSDFVKGVNDHPAGTKFALAGGNYKKTWPIKAGNRYDGDPSDPFSFMGDGVKSAPLLVATVPNVSARHFKAEGFGPSNTDEGSGIIDYRSGGNGWLLENFELSHTSNSLVRWGPGWTLRDFWLHHAGRYAQSAGGGGAVKTIERGKWSFIGKTDDGVTAVASSNRGGCKFAKTNNGIVRGLIMEDIGWNGFWLDIQNQNWYIEDISGKRIGRSPMFLEVSYGPVMVVRPKFDDFGFVPKSGDEPAGIKVSMTPDVTVVDPDINNGPNGIIAIQWAHPQILGVKNGEPFGDTDKSKCGNENLLVHGTGRITNIDKITAGLSGTYQKGTRPSKNMKWDLRFIQTDAGANYSSALTIPA